MATTRGDEAHVQDQAYPRKVEHSGPKYKEDECSKKKVSAVPDRCSYEGKGREVPVGAEEMAEHMSSEALSRQIMRLKHVGRTTRCSQLLFATCLIQMVMGSREQPREFIKETYVYVEAASLWMYVLTLLVMMILFMQFLSMYGSKNKTQAGALQEPDGGQTPLAYGAPDVETEDEVEREDEDERQDDEQEENEDEGENQEEVPAQPEVQEREELPMRGNINANVNNEPERDPEPGPVPQPAVPVLPPPPAPVQQPQGVRLRGRLECAVTSGRRYHGQGCGSLDIARRIAMDVRRRLRYRPCLVCNPPQLPDP